MNLTQDDLDAWRANPVTEYLMGLMSQHLKERQVEYKDMYWEGAPTDNSTYAFAKAYESILTSLMEADADDFAQLESADAK